MPHNTTNSNMASVNIFVNTNTPEPEPRDFPQRTFAILDHPGLDEDTVDEVAAYGGSHYNVVVLQHRDYFDFIHGNDDDDNRDEGFDVNGIRGASITTPPPLPALLPRVWGTLSSLEPQAGIVNPLSTRGALSGYGGVPGGYFTPQTENVPVDDLMVMLAEKERMKEMQQRKMAHVMTFSEQCARDEIKRKYPRPVITKQQREAERAAAEEKLGGIMGIYGLGASSKAQQDRRDVNMTIAF